MTKRILSLIITFCMIIVALPVGVFAGASDIPCVTYIDKDGSQKQCDSYTVLTSDTTTLTDGWYVSDNTFINSNNITITGNVNIILTDNSSFIARGGIIDTQDDVTSVLNIYSQTENDGYLGFDSCYFADTGNTYGLRCGALNIYGGRIEAMGSNTLTDYDTQIIGIATENGGLNAYRCTLSSIGQIMPTLNHSGTGTNVSCFGVYANGNVNIDNSFVVFSGGNITGDADIVHAQSFGLHTTYDINITNGSNVLLESGKAVANGTQLATAMSVGAYVDENMSVTDSFVTAKSGEATSDAALSSSESIGINTNYLDLNGGAVDSKGAGAEATSNESATAYSYGAKASYGISMHDGNHTFTGGNTAATFESDSNDIYVQSISTGLYTSGDMEVTSSIVTAEGKEASVNDILQQSINTGFAASYGLEISWGTLTINDGNINTICNDISINRGRRFSAPVYTYDLTITDGTLACSNNNVSADDTDIYVHNDMKVSGGTIISCRGGGALNPYINNLIISGGNMKIFYGYIGSLQISNGLNIESILQDGYSLYDYDTDTCILNTETQRNSESYIDLSPVTVYLNENDITAKTLDLSNIPYTSSNPTTISLEAYNTDMYTANVNSRDLKIEFSINNGVSGDSDDLIADISNGGYNIRQVIHIVITDKVMPTVTAKSNTLTPTYQKSYDGKAVNTDILSQTFSVTYNGQEIDGSWQWQGAAPTNVTNCDATAVFFPFDSDSYSPVSAVININITPKELTSTPGYTALTDNSMTLLNAKLKANNNWPAGIINFEDDNGRFSFGVTVTPNYEYPWTFVPYDKQNYTEATGKVILLYVTDELTNNGTGNTLPLNPPRNNTDNDNNHTKDPSDTNTDDNLNGNNSNDNNLNDNTQWTDKFTDLAGKNHWAENDINDICGLGLMQGVSDSLFKPDEFLSRGMLVTILYRIEGSPIVSYDNPFKDVSKDSYYYDAIMWAAQNNIITGLSSDTFAPEYMIGRGDTATIIYRYAKYKGIAPKGAWAIRLTYKDIDNIQDYQTEGIMYCTLNNIMQGNEDNTFAPNFATTRGESAAIINRFIKNVLSSDLSK